MQVGHKCFHESVFIRKFCWNWDLCVKGSDLTIFLFCKWLGKQVLSLRHMFPFFYEEELYIFSPHLPFWHKKTVWMKLLFEVLTSSWKKWQSNKRKRSSFCVSGYFQLPFSAALQGMELSLRSALCHWWHVGQSREGRTGRALWMLSLCHGGGKESVAASSHVGDKQELEGHTALGTSTLSWVIWMCFPTSLRCWR